MKRQLLSFLFIGTAAVSIAQTQIGNSGFETWETAGSGEEPTNWSSFLTATGSLSWAASDQCESSTDIRPGSSGTKSAHIFSLDIFGTIANGNVTLGRINMGSASPADPSNYSSSVTSDANYSEAFTASPDSIVFWAKYTPASGNTTDSARVSAIIHDNYAFRDPIDANSQPHIVATAIKNYGKTNGSWVRMSVPFTYSGPASSPQFMLVTFATNKTPGGGSGNDEVWIDDVELIYNPLGVTEMENAPIAMKNANGIISFTSAENIVAPVAIYNLNGETVAIGTTTEIFNIENNGVYFIHFTVNGQEFVNKVAVY